MPLFAPNDSLGSGAALEDGALNSDKILDELLSSDDLKVDEGDDKLDSSKKEETKEEESEPETEIEDDKEIKLNEEEVDESKLEFTDLPSRKEILKAFPELYKKFPALESAIYREQQYSEVFPNINDAKLAKENSENYEKFEASLLDGDIGSVLKSVKEADSNAFGKLSEQFLYNLHNVDKEAYTNVITNVLKDTAISMFNAGAKMGDGQEAQNLKLAAQILHQFFFNDSKISPYSHKHKLASGETKVNPDEERLSKREESFMQQQLDVASNDVTSSVENLIRRSVGNQIDPNGKMSDYVKNKAIEDIISAVDNEINSDARFRKVLDNLWLDSGKNNFNQASKTKIKNALLGKAKTILPAIARRVRAEALKGSAARNRNDREEDTPLPRGRAANSSNSSSRSESNKADGDKKIPKKMTTLEYLNS